jgi:hypothetical protein
MQKTIAVNPKLSGDDDIRLRLSFFFAFPADFRYFPLASATVLE